MIWVHSPFLQSFIPQCTFHVALVLEDANECYQKVLESLVQIHLEKARWKQIKPL